MEDENQGRSPPSVVEISETNEKETLTDSLKPLWKLVSNKIWCKLIFILLCRLNSKISVTYL